MDQAKGKEELSVLVHSVQNLIDGYDHAEALLKSQIQAVVDNDFDILNQLISEQLEHYEKLSELESIFREQLAEAYHKMNPDNSKPKLAKLIHLYNGGTSRLYILRDDLIRKVNRVRTLSLQLLDLLKYAQDLNIGTLRAVMAATGKHDVHYDQKGKKESQGMANISIDQKG